MALEPLCLLITRYSFHDCICRAQGSGHCELKQQWIEKNQISDHSAHGYKMRTNLLHVSLPFVLKVDNQYCRFEGLFNFEQATKHKGSWWQQKSQQKTLDVGTQIMMLVTVTQAHFGACISPLIRSREICCMMHNSS